MHLGASRGERFYSRLGSGETERLMACADQLGDEGGTNKTRGTGDEEAHLSSCRTACAGGVDSVVRNPFRYTILMIPLTIDMLNGADV